MQLVKIEPFMGAEAVPRHERELTREKGGISLKQEEEVGLWDTLSSFSRKISAKLLSGKFNFSTMQRPAALSNPISHVQVLADEYCVLVKYIEAAVGVKDPLERLKLLSAGLVGTLALNVFTSRGKGPVNPCLGETFHGRSASDAQAFVEQLSISPPMTQVLVLGAGGAFTLSALLRVG